MPVFNNILAGAAGSGGDAGFKIERSLRIDDVSNATLTRTPSTAGNRKTWTLSFWVKRTEIGGAQLLFNAGNTSNGDHSVMRFNGDRFQMYQYGHGGDTTAWSGGNGSQLRTSAKFRDPSAWMHIVVAMDTTQATQSDRLKYYINGVLQTEFDSTNYPARDSNPGYWNATDLHCWGSQVQNTSPSGSSDYLLAEVHMVDGQQLAASDFGEYDDNNVWQPKEFTNHVIAEALGATSPTVLISKSSANIDQGNVLYLNSNPDSATYPVIHDSASGEAERDRTIRVKFHSAISGVTSIKFRGGGVSSGENYTLYVNGTQVGGTHTTNSQWSEDSHTITSTDVTEIKIIGAAGFALGQLKLNDSLVSGTPSYGTHAEGTNSFYLDFSDNSSDSALGTDSSGNNNNWTVNNINATAPSNSGPFSGADAYSGTTQNSYGSSTGSWNSAFDGSTTTGVYIQNNTGQTILTMLNSASWSSQIRVRSQYMGGGSTGWYRLNSTQFNPPSSNQWTDVTSTMGSSGTLTSVGVRDYAQLFAIELDGEILIDSDSAARIDSLLDSPTNYDDGTNVGGNYATINPLQTKSYSSGSPTIANGNLEIDTSGTGWSSAAGTIAVSSGKWYWEYTCSNLSGSELIRNGIYKQGGVLSGTGGDDGTSPDVYTYASNAQKWTGSAFTSYGASYTTGDVIGVALDLDAGTLTFYKNGSSQGSAYTGLSGTFSPYFSQSSDPKSLVNFGQRPFAYTPPSNHLPLVTTSLGDPTISDGSTAMDAITYTGNGSSKTISGVGFSPDLIWTKTRNQARSHYLMDLVRGISKYLISEQTSVEGTNTTNRILSVTSDGWTLGTNNSFNGNNDTYVAWAWDAGANSSKTYTVKVVSDSGNKYRFDDFGTSAVTLDLEEGSTYVFDQSDSSNSGHPLRFSTTSDGTHGSGSEYTTGVTTTGTPGSAGAKTTIVVASGAPTLYYYCSSHSGMGGQANTNSTAGASNFDGSIQSTCRTNQSAGFSIVSYTGNATNGSTIGHNLNAVPEFAIFKDRDTTRGWAIYHKDVDPKVLNFDSAAAITSQEQFNQTTPTSSVFTLGSGGRTNQNGSDVICYAFTSVSQYSSFGSYEGNDSSDGPFVFTGMRPRLIMIKNADATGSWVIYDTARDDVNAASKRLFPNLSSVESDTTSNDLDILSNGFKIRSTGNAFNSNNTTYIYAAFGEQPIKSARAA